jgi:hypothetical protein
VAGFQVSISGRFWCPPRRPREASVKAFVSPLIAQIALRVVATLDAGRPSGLEALGACNGCGWTGQVARLGVRAAEVRPSLWRRSGSDTDAFVRGDPTSKGATIATIARGDHDDWNTQP